MVIKELRKKWRDYKAKPFLQALNDIFEKEPIKDCSDSWYCCHQWELDKDTFFKLLVNYDSGIKEDEIFRVTLLYKSIDRQMKCRRFKWVGIYVKDISDIAYAVDNLFSILEKSKQDDTKYIQSGGTYKEM